jgi:hypothetical protein
VCKIEGEASSPQTCGTKQSNACLWRWPVFVNLTRDNISRKYACSGFKKRAPRAVKETMKFAKLVRATFIKDQTFVCGGCFIWFRIFEMEVASPSCPNCQSYVRSSATLRSMCFCLFPDQRCSMAVKKGNGVEIESRYIARDMDYPVLICFANFLRLYLSRVACGNFLHR